MKRASPYEQDLLASRKVTSRSSSRSVLLPTIKITMAGLASVLASVSQLARQLNDSLKSLFEPNQMITNMFQKTLIIHQPVSKPGGNVIHQQCPCCPSVITSRHTAKPLLKKVMIFSECSCFKAEVCTWAFYLARCVPNLKLDSLATHRNNFASKLDPNCVCAVLFKLPLYELGM